MIKTEIKYKGKKYIKEIPESWEECKLSNVIRLEAMPEDNDLIDVLCCFIDLPKEIIDNTSSNLWQPLFKILEFVYNPPKWTALKRPSKLQLNGKLVKVPSNLGMETFGQKVLALQAIEKHKQKLSGLPELLTIYLQPKYDGKYSRMRQGAVRELVDNTLAIESIPIGLFFLQEVAKAEELWNVRFKEIPKDIAQDNLFFQSGGERLGPYNDLIIIDSLAKLYGYSHDEVFHLEWDFINNLLYVHQLQDHIKEKMNKLHKTLHK